MLGGARNVPFGVALDSIGRSNATHTPPRLVIRDILNFHLGHASWMEIAHANYISVDEALQVVRGQWVQPGTSTGNYWLSKYGDQPFYRPSVDRLSFLAHNQAAGEFDPLMALEPQMYILDVFSQMFCESVNFHFNYLAELDELYHATRGSGPQGTFNHAADSTPYENQYRYWRDVVDTTYIQSGLVVLPPHLQGAAGSTGTWRIMDVLSEIVTMMSPDGTSLHPEIFITAKGCMLASTGSTLGLKSDPSYKDESGFDRFYTPMFQLAQTSPLAYAIAEGDVNVILDGDDTLTVESWGNPDTGAYLTSGSYMAQAPMHQGRAGWEELYRSRGVNDFAYRSSTRAGVGGGITDTVAYGSGTVDYEVKSPPDTNEDITFVKGMGLDIYELSLGGSSGFPVYGGTNGARNYNVNLVTMIELARRIGRSLDVDIQNQILPAFGQVQNLAGVLIPDSGLSIQAHDALYNLYASEFSFKENPVRRFTLAHLGPVHDVVDVNIGDIALSTTPAGSGPMTAYQRYWQPTDLSDVEAGAIIEYYFPNGEYTLTAAGAITIDELVQTGYLNNELVTRMYGGSPSMHTKVEKPVILPAGVTGPEGVYASGADETTTKQQLYELFMSAGGATPMFGLGHQGWVDWVRSPSASVAVPPTWGPATDVDLVSATSGVGAIVYLSNTDEVHYVADRQASSVVNNLEGFWDIYDTIETEASWGPSEDAVFNAVLYQPDPQNLFDTVANAPHIYAEDGRFGATPYLGMTHSMYGSGWSTHMGSPGFIGPTDFEPGMSATAINSIGGNGAHYFPSLTCEGWGMGNWGAMRLGDGVTDTPTVQDWTNGFENQGLVRVDPLLATFSNGIQYALDAPLGWTHNTRLNGLQKGSSLWLHDPNATGYIAPGAGEYWLLGTNQDWAGSQSGVNTTRCSLYTPECTLPEMILGLANTGLSMGDIDASNFEDRTITGFEFSGTSITLEVTVAFNYGSTAGVGSGTDGTVTNDTTYWVGWRSLDPQASSLFYDEPSGLGVVVSQIADWTRAAVGGEVIQDTPFHKTHEWEWIIVCDDASNVTPLVEVEMYGGSGFPLGTSANRMPFTWIMPGDPRSGGVTTSPDHGIRPQAAPAQDAGGFTFVAAGQVVRMEDVAQLDYSGVGEYSRRRVAIDVDGASTQAGLRLGLWNAASVYPIQSYTGGSYSTPLGLPNLNPWTSNQVQVTSSFGVPSGTAGLGLGSRAQVGVNRRCPVYSIPDEPDKRKQYRPFRTLADAAILKEQKLYLVPTHERLDIQGGPLGIPYYGRPQPFMMDAIVRSANLPDQYLLEGTTAMTRLVDDSNRGMLTFSKTNMLDPNRGGLQRGLAAMADVNASFIRRSNAHGSAADGSFIYSIDAIRYIQMGRQYQRL